MNYNAPLPSYPSNLLNKSSNFYSLFNKPLVYNKKFNNCNNTLCYTWNHNYIYKPHSGYGSVGTSAAGSLAQRRRL